MSRSSIYQKQLLKRRWHSSTSNNKTSSSFMDTVKALGIGAFAGVCGSLAGMGGGFVMIPLMTSRLFLNLSQHQAHGTSLFAVTTTGLAGAISYSDDVNWEAAAAIASVGIITARFGAIFSTKLSATALKKALGVFMICIAPLVPAKKYILEMNKSQNLQQQQQIKRMSDKIDIQTSTNNIDNGKADSNPLMSPSSYIPMHHHHLITPAMIGVGSGFLSGLFGVGGGAIVVPALTIFVTDISSHYQALGTSLCAMTLPAIMGTATHYSKGNVAMRIAPPLAIGAFCGGYLGGKLGLKTNEDILRYGFSALMLTLGVRTILKA